MPDEEAPPVVAVLVASDPGPWFEECLAALGAQDYPNLSVLVVDAASRNNPAARVAAVLPQAFLRRVEQNRGFGATANDALGAVRGASHLLLCHDDIAPAPDAVRRMVEEAFRSNAGVVAPKFVAWDDPRRLLQVGLSADRLGAPVSRVERDEVDQSQHDEVRDVFVAPGGCTLVRADLFERLGGFDEEISLFGEDLDLCWRAQIAGARVVVAPSAVVRHLEATAGGVRRRPDKRLLQRRHEIRAVLKNYAFFHRLLATVQLALLSSLEAVYCAASGDRARARQITAAWRWNLSKARGLRAARRRVRSTRALSDHAVSIQQLGSQRLRRFVRARLNARDPAHPDEGARGAAARAGLALAPTWLRTSSRSRTEALSVISVLVLVLAVGMRGIFFSDLPLLGGLAPFPGATSLLSKFFDGWQAGGLARHAGAPPAFGLIGGLGLILFGSTATLQKLIVIGAVIVGAIGASRMVAPFGSSRGRIVAAVAYLATPLYWNDIAKADLGAMVAFAGVPFLLTRLARASRIPPFDASRTVAPLSTEIVGFALQLALVGVFDPVIILLTLLAAVAISLGSVIAGEVRNCGRMILVTGAGSAGAIVLTLPWSASFFESGARWSVLSGALSAETRAVGITGVVRFDFGPMGSGLLAFGLLAAAVFPLLVARGPRLSFATRWWLVALSFFALSWAGTRGWLGAGGADLGVFLAPAAAAVAATVALGVITFEQDLPGFRFGWRQLATAGAAVCAIAGMLPFLAGTLSGRFGLATIGYDQPFSFIDSSGPAAAGDYQVLWLGDPASLPMRSWQLSPGAAVGVSAGGLPDATTDLWPSPSPGPVEAMVSDVSLARRGLTVELGHLLAPLDVRYLVLTTSAVPVLSGLQSGASLPEPAALVASLVEQQDLRQVPSEAGAYVFVNTAWSSAASPAVLPGTADPPLGFLGSGLGAAFEIVLLVLACGVVLRRRVRSRSERGLDRPVGAAATAAGASAPRPRQRPVRQAGRPERSPQQKRRRYQPPSGQKAER